MTLKLLLNLLFIVWGVSATNKYTNQELPVDSASVAFCSHDGYMQDNSCVCGTDYTGNFCLNRKCRNFGFDGRLGIDGQGVVATSDRCICPPGFLGRNCEPVKCVSGDQQVFTTSNSEKTISLLATFNTQMEELWKSGNIGDIVCNYTQYNRNFNYNFNNFGFSISSNTSYEDCKSKVDLFLDPDTCKDEDEKPIACQQLDVGNLNTLVQNSQPNSIVFVVTNMITSSVDAALAEKIIGTAIAKRIQINVIVYNNTLPLLLANDPTLTYLSNIASATFGTFVLPSVDSNNEQYGIVNTLLKNWDSDIGVSAIFTNEVKNLPTDTSYDLFVAAQTYYTENLNFNTDLPPTVSKTDFWKIYKLSAGSIPSILSISNQVDGTPILVYSAGRIKAYSAFTSDVDTDSVIDVSYAVSVVGASYPLVFRLESAGNVLTYSDIQQTIGKPKTISISTQSHRTQCQFNLQYSSTCNSVGASVITVVTTDKRSVSFPVYCASTDFAASVFNLIEDNRVEVLASEEEQVWKSEITCSTEAQKEEVGSRSFVIIAENTKDTTYQNRSSVDNVFRNKNSIFYQLGDFLTSDNYLATPIYSGFRAALHNGPTPTAVFSANANYSIFLTKVMAATANSADHIDTDSGPIEVTNLLVNTIENSREYSDILFVVNYNISIDSATVDPTAVKEALAKMRSRLYVTFVQTYVTISNDVYEYMNDLAVASGGVAVRLNTYDDLHTFFIQYFPVLVTNDIVAKSYSENQKAGIALNNVYLTADQYILLLTNQDLAGDGIINASISVNNISVEALPQIGELQMFTLTPKVAASYNIPVLFSTSGLARIANVVLFTKSGNTDIVSLSFLSKDNELRNNVVYGEGAFIPYFYSSSPFAPTSTVTITYSDPQNPTKAVYTGDITGITDSSNTCGDFNYTTNFNWICSISGGLYHVKIDRVSDQGTISRTFPVTCLGDSSGSCLNGGTENKQSGGCNCPLEWTGTLCEAPRCQNGGTKTDADTCSCLPAFTGSFCEIGLTQCLTPPPSQPEYLSDLSSIFIVADTEALKVSSLTKGLDITGVPISVILYGDGSAPRLVQSTTNGQHVVEVLGAPSASTPADGGSTTSAPTQNDMYNAINLALDNQFTDRSYVIVLTSNPDSDVNGDLLIRLAAKRTEIRVLSTSIADLSTNFLTLSLVGNGIPYVVRSGDFEKYLQSYLVPLFNALQYTKSVPQRVFNVFQSGTIRNDSVSIAIPSITTFDNSKSIAYVHVYNGLLKTVKENATIGNTRVYVRPFDANSGLEMTFEQTTTGVDGYYLIEVVNYVKTAYGFNNDTSGANEVLNYGVSYGKTNAITISPAPAASLPLSNPANFPYLIIQEILTGNVSVPSTVLFTRKNETNCFYKYFSVLDVCSQSSTIGYQVQLITKNEKAELRQQQFVLTCHKTNYASGTTTCGGTGSPISPTCTCDSGFTGIDCSKPICQNGGVRDYSVCRCPLQYYGRLCADVYVASSTTTAPPSGTTTLSPAVTSTLPSTAPTTVTTTQGPEVRAAAFVIDVIGTDDYAFNQTTQSILEYVKAFNNVHYVMLVGNWDTGTTVNVGFQHYDSLDVLSKNLSFLWTVRKTQADSKVASLSKALTGIATSYSRKSDALKNAVSMNIFYDTQIKLADDDDPTTVTGLDSFTKSAVVFSPFAVNADQTIVDSLNKFSNDVKNVRDFYGGVVAMTASTAQNTAVLPTKPNRQCVFGLQSNINLPIDRSKPTSDAVEVNLKTFLSNFRNGFNYIENDEASVCTLDALPNYYNERSAITAFAYYNGVVKPVSFCPSQYTSYLSFSVNGTNESASYSTKTVTYMGKYINQDNCFCNRYQDETTFKYIIWLPRSSAPLNDGAGTDWAPLWALNTPNAYHFVVPFYDLTDKDNDLYYQILKNQDTVKQKGADWYLLNNAATNDVNEIINTLYEKLCQIADVDPTAIPPELDSLQFSNRNEYSELWN